MRNAARKTLAVVAAIALLGVALGAQERGLDPKYVQLVQVGAGKRAPAKGERPQRGSSSGAAETSAEKIARAEKAVRDASERLRHAMDQMKAIVKAAEDDAVNRHERALGHEAATNDERDARQRARKAAADAVKQSAEWKKAEEEMAAAEKVRNAAVAELQALEDAQKAAEAQRQARPRK